MAPILWDSSGNPAAIGYVQGAGYGPLLNFPPATQTLALNLGPGNLYEMAIDAGYNLYFIDATHNRVVKESWFGGRYSQSIPITGLNYPEGIALDGAGVIYISDTFNHRVLKETPTPTGYASSLLTAGITYPEGLAVDANGNLYVTDFTYNHVYKETLSNGTYIQSTIGTSIYLPEAVTVDSAGNVYIAAVNPNASSGLTAGWVIKETPSNGAYTQSVVASGFVLNVGVAVDANGNVYIADDEANKVYKETLAAGVYTQSTIGSNLTFPWNVAVE